MRLASPIFDTKRTLPFCFGWRRGLSQFGKFERSDDWSSCAYFYLDRPENNLPQLDAAEKRMAGL